MDTSEITLTLPLLDGPLSALNTLKGAPVSCLFAMLVIRKPVRHAWLCQATGYSSNSVTAAIRLLEYLNLIVRAPDRMQGWQVTAGYTALLDCDESGQPADGCPEAHTLNPAQADLLTSNRDREHVKGGGGGSINRLMKPPPSMKTSALQYEVPVEHILAASSLLFGECIHGPPSRYPDPPLLLATIADVYSRRQVLRNPARVAYANLKNGVIPPQPFIDEPCRFLPADFLLAAGLPIPPEEPTLSEDELPEPAPQQSGADYPPPHPSLSLQINPGGDSSRTAADAWEIAYRTLRDELPRPVFIRWVAGLKLTEFQPDGCVFTLQADSPQARDWLADRLSARLKRLLQGICNTPAALRFIPP